MQIDDELFEKLMTEAMDLLPEKYVSNLDNVAIVFEGDPSSQQRTEMELRHYQTLFGLYQGVPLIKRGLGYNLMPPDKITLFKNPLVHASRSIDDLKDNIRHTLWHEIGHHFGLQHDRIHELDDLRKRKDSSSD